MAIYFLTLDSPGEVGKVHLGVWGGKQMEAIPAEGDGAVAWMEAIFVTDVPTQTAIPTLTPTRDKTNKPTRTPTVTPTFTPTGPTATASPTKTKGPSPTPTDTATPTATPTTHAYFIGYVEPVSVYNTYGASSSVASLTVNEHFYLVIADGDNGLQVVDATNPDQTVTYAYPIPQANAVKIIGTTAYIAAGDAGVILLDLSNPEKPQPIDRRKTIGSATGLDVFFRPATYPDPATGADRVYTITRIYVALGDKGMQVLSLYPIRTDQESHNAQAKSITYKKYFKVLHLDTGDTTLNVSVSHDFQEKELVFVADGKNGVQVLNLSTNYRRLIQPTDVFRQVDIPYAWDAICVKLVEHRAKNDKQLYWLFVAAGKDGVFVYKVDFGDNADQPTITAYKTIDTPGEARAVSAYHNNIFVGDGEGGVRVIDFNDIEHPKLLGSGRYEFDWTKVPIVYAVKEWRRNAESPGSAATLFQVLLDGMFCTVSLAAMAFLLAGLLLPVHSIRERFQVLGRVGANLVNRHGPFLVIEDGRLRYRTDPEQQHGVGVTLQDADSTSVFTEHPGSVQTTDPRLAFSGSQRASGAQLTFTGQDEHMVWPVELRRRPLLIGPREDDLDPFKMRADDEDRSEYRMRQRRRRATTAMTTDGKEIVPRLRIVYSREGGPVDEQNEFGYGSGLISNAYRGENPPAIDTRSDELKYLEGRRPSEEKLEKLVSELWRLNLAKYSLEQLFPHPANLVQPTAWMTIRTDITDLLVDHQTEKFDTLQDAPNITELREIYRELFGGVRHSGTQPGQQPDPGRGIRVHDVSIDAIYLSEEDVRQMCWAWIKAWQDGKLLPEEDLKERSGRETLIQFAEYALQYFEPCLAEGAGNDRLVDNLWRLLCGSLQALPKDSSEYKRLAAIIQRLGGKCP